MRAVEHATREACEKLVIALDAEPRAATFLGPRASTIEERVDWLIERYLGTEALHLTARLGRTAVAPAGRAHGVPGPRSARRIAAGRR